MPRSEAPIDRVLKDARHIIDCLDHGYLSKDEAESECFARLRRSLEAHRIACVGERLAPSLSERPDHSQQEAAAA